MGGVASSYLMKKDGSKQIPAQINQPTDDFSPGAKYALVKGKLFIFGGKSDEKKVKCRFIRIRLKILDRET